MDTEKRLWTKTVQVLQKQAQHDQSPAIGDAILLASAWAAGEDDPELQGNYQVAAYYAWAARSEVLG